MVYAVDPDSDFFLLDNLEPVTVRSDSSDAGTAVPHAWRSYINTRDAAASGGRFLTADVRWHVHIDEYPTFPLPGYQVVDEDGTVWTALEVKRADVDSRHRLVCRDLYVTEGLNNRLTILVARNTKGPAGDAKPDWCEWRSGVLGRIQADRTDTLVDSGMRSEDAKFSIVLSEQIAFASDLSDHRILGPDGTLYRIDSVDRYDRIDILPLLSCTEVGPFHR